MGRSLRNGKNIGREGRMTRVAAEEMSYLARRPISINRLRQGIAGWRSRSVKTRWRRQASALTATLSAAGLPTMDGQTGTTADRAKRWRLIRSLLRLSGVEQYLDSESPAPHRIGGQEGVDGVSSAFNPGLSLGGGECRQGILVGQRSLVMQSDKGIGECLMASG